MCLWWADGLWMPHWRVVFQNQSNLHFKAKDSYFIPLVLVLDRMETTLSKWLSLSFLSFPNGLRSLLVSTTFSVKLPQCFHIWAFVSYISGSGTGVSLWAVMGLSCSHPVAGSPDGEKHGSLVFYIRQHWEHFPLQLPQSWWEMLGEIYSTA